MVKRSQNSVESQTFESADSDERKLLVIDTSFSYQAIKSRQLEHSVTCRDLGGFFKKVWSVHPFGSLVSDASVTKYGPPDVHAMNSAHVFMDGKEGAFRFLSWAPRVNFLVGQVCLIARLIKLVWSEGIDVIRVADPLYNGLLGLIVSRITRVPLLVRVGANHDEIFKATGVPMMPRIFPNRRLEKSVGRYVLARADAIACANQNNLKFAKENGAPFEKCTLFRYGNLIDSAHFIDPEDRVIDRDWLDRYEITPHLFLLCVARLEAMKRPQDAVTVLAELKRRGHDLKLVMAGDGAMLESLKEQALSLGVLDRVVFCGNQTQATLSTLYPLAAVVLSPLAGRALTEAALAGAKIVAYDLDWQREIVIDDVTGALVSNEDVTSMAGAADKILSDSDYALKLSHGARQHALDMMDPEKLDQHERNTYIGLIDRKSRKRNGA